MKKTKKEFMVWLGLKRGDMIEAKGKRYIVLPNCSLYSESVRYEQNMSLLLDKEFHIVERPKCVGNMLCQEISCNECCIHSMCKILRNCEDVNKSLYEILEEMKLTDEDIYNLLKDRLDEEVLEE